MQLGTPRFSSRRTASQATVASKARVCPLRPVAAPKAPRSAVGSRAQSSSPAERRPPVPPARCPSPDPASGAGPHRGRTTVARRPQRPQRRDSPLRGRTRATTSMSRFGVVFLELRRTRSLQSRCAGRSASSPRHRPHIAHVGCPLLWFLEALLDKPEHLRRQRRAPPQRENRTHGKVRRAGFCCESAPCAKCLELPLSSVESPMPDLALPEPPAGPIRPLPTVLPKPSRAR